MRRPENGSPHRYVVVEGDRYEADRERALLATNLATGPIRAEQWAQGLARRTKELSDFPGPLSHARDEDASLLYGREVRRLLYYGSGRRSKQPVRILFTLISPALDDPDGETVIYLLRLLRGGQSLIDPDAPEANP